MARVGVVGVGSYLPDNVLTNKDLEKMVNTSDEWIITRTGIRERRIAPPGVSTCHLAYEAARRALDDAKISPEEIDLIIVATNSPDTLFPPTACRVQAMLGASIAGAFDLQAGCTSPVYAMAIVEPGIKNGCWKNVLIVGVEVLSRIINWEDRNTCVLFGDGAGAIVMKLINSGGIIDFELKSDGTKADYIELPAGLAAMPATEETVRKKLHTVHMKGNEVFKYVVKVIPTFMKSLLDRNGLAPEDINWYIFHQANIRIIDAILERFGIGKERAIVNLDKYGNTSAATIFIALDEAVKDGRIKRGDKLMLVSFGSGMTYGGVIMEW
ncbi:MAG: ketoacyl-ACP synthase III [Synergistetes bacterium]|nr:ketoacyl-ACP synthase III [Synergistota bacterium]MCX8127806.1 ketoacyl-ACP synthase III [Synergistota bacterium]MDW8192068.1 beta-ketoacyl-ACP synthase III [Synergistota bacterium]